MRAVFREWMAFRIQCHRHVDDSRGQEEEEEAVRARERVQPASSQEL
jgi:hypothetical protein